MSPNDNQIISELNKGDGLNDNGSESDMFGSGIEADRKLLEERARANRSGRAGSSPRPVVTSPSPPPSARQRSSSEESTTSSRPPSAQNTVRGSQLSADKDKKGLKGKHFSYF